jgi:formylglycine-generating enzyme required for sulfatase activity
VSQQPSGAPKLGLPAPDFASTGQPEPGVCEWGEDTYGRNGRGWFIGFRVGEVVQRLRWIPPGSFLMGSTESDRQGVNDERPQRHLRLRRGFWLADTQVTQALWGAVMGENPSRFQDLKHPVERVSWHDAQVFLARLNNLVPWLRAVLPTEAQWEYACRADSTTQYWSGDAETDLTRVGWCFKNSSRRTHPVACHSASPWGLHDMHGNVWEWCQDYWESYDELAPSDLAGPERGEYHVIRGGAWQSEARSARSASRNGGIPDTRDDALGFRLARGQPDQSGTGTGYLPRPQAAGTFRGRRI